MKHQKGFTIIELIIVIAVIAILASIVLVSIVQYITQGKDAAIKGNIDAMVKNATQFFETNNTYVGFITGGNCDSSDSLAGQMFIGPQEAIVAAGGAVSCPDATATDFCVIATLNNGSSVCIDASGFKGPPDPSGCSGSTLTCQ